MKKYRYIISAFLYSLFVGISFVATKIIANSVGADIILAHRFLLALIIYLIITRIFKYDLLINKKKLLVIMPATLFYPLFFFSLQLLGLQSATSSEAGIIFATVPIITIIIYLLIGKRISLVQVIFTFVSVSGVIIIVSSNFVSSNGNILGSVFLLLSAFSFSIYTILLGKILKQVTIPELTIVLMITGALFFNGFSFISLVINERSIVTYFAPFKSMTYMLAIIYLGSFASVFASLASNYSLKGLSAPQFSVFSNLATVISVISGALILGEKIHLYHIGGGLLILAGVIGANLHNK